MCVFSTLPSLRSCATPGHILPQGGSLDGTEVDLGNNSRNWIVPHPKEQISNIFNGKIINQAYSKRTEQQSYFIPHLLILPLSENFLVWRYNHTKRNHILLLPSFGNSWIWETEILERDCHVISKFRIFFLIHRSKHREKGWTDLLNQIIVNVRYWPLYSDPFFIDSWNCYNITQNILHYQWKNKQKKIIYCIL